MKNLRYYIIIIILLGLTNDSFADDKSNGRSMGLSLASDASSFGIDAYGINPANFDIHRRFYPALIKLDSSKKKFIPKWEFSILSIGGGFGSDQSISFYNNYLKYLSINRSTFTNLFTNFSDVLNFRQNVLPSQNTGVNYDLEMKWFSLSYLTSNKGTFNFTITDEVGLNTNANSRDIEMPLNYQYYIDTAGKSNLVNVNLNQSQATAWWIRKYSVAYSKNFEFKRGLIKSLAAGISASLVHGFGAVLTYNSSINMNTYGIKYINGSNHVDSINGKKNYYILSSLTDMFQDYRDGARSHFDFFPTPAGEGYSIDIGFNMQLGEKFRIAASVTDIGKITWNYNTILNNDTNTFSYQNFFLNTNDPTYQRFVNNLDGIYTRQTGITFTTNMPTKYHLGVMYQPKGNFMLELDWIKGDNNYPGNTTRHLVAAGGEYYPLEYLPLRAGFSIGGMDLWTISIGSGIRLRNLEIDIAALGINNAIANKRLNLAFSTKIFL